MAMGKCLIVVLTCLSIAVAANNANQQQDLVFRYGENETSPATSGQVTATKVELTNWEVSPEATVEALSLSPCYGAINFHILQRGAGRINVVESETVQFSLSFNKTSDAYSKLLNSSPSEDCSVVWVRVVVEPVTIKSAALVDSQTDIFAQNLVESRVVKIHRNRHFPVRLYARGLFLGYSNLHFQALLHKNASADASKLPDSQWVTFRTGKIATFREHRSLDFIFQAVIFCLIICGNIGIGLDINWEEIRDVIKKPIGPAIGFCCQYICMPLAGFTLTRLINLPPNISLGIFLVGCAPGGGGSNYHTYFLGGNLPLSVTMTFVSTIAGIGMMPFWVFTLGRMVIDEAHSGIRIDFKGIVGALFTSITPFLIGICIHWRRPALATRIFNVFVRPLLLFIFVYMITVGLYTNAYIFSLLRLRVLLAAVCLPYTGFTLGFVIATLLKQPRSIAITVAIETGIQAVAIALTTVMLSLPQPDADIAVVGPLSVAMFTPIPLWTAEIIRGIYICHKKGRCFIFDTCRQRLNRGPRSEEESVDDAEAVQPSQGEETQRPTVVTMDDLESKVAEKPHLSPKGKQYVRDSGLMPLLSAGVESPISEHDPSIAGASAVTSESSERSTLVPSPITIPVDDGQQQGGNEAPPETKQDGSNLAPAPQRRSDIESIYVDAES